MSILDKIKKTEAKPKAEKVKVTKVAKDLQRNKLSKDKVGLSIIEPLITEKSSILASLNKYVFKVKGNTTKNEVKKAIEGYYNVNVLDANILKTAPKPKRVGKWIDMKPGYKKAIVTIKSGESIELVKS